MDEQLMHAVAPVEVEYFPVPHSVHTPDAVDAPIMHIVHWAGSVAPVVVVVNAVGHWVQAELAGALE